MGLRSSWETTVVTNYIHEAEGILRGHENVRSGTSNQAYTYSSWGPENSITHYIYGCD